MLALVILIPCCLVGVGVYAAMSRWELPSDPSSSGGGGYSGYSPRSSLPRLTFRDTMADWPIPQFQRLHPGVLVALSAVAAVWIVAWIVVFFVGLGMLNG